MPRGRKSKRKNALREPNGQLQRTPTRSQPIERSGVEARRIQVMGIDPAKYENKRHPAERDMRLSTPLGLIRARVLITEAEYLAGEEFHSRWESAQRPKHPQSCIHERLSRGVAEGGASARQENLYRDAHDCLKAVGTEAYRQVVNIVLYEHYPRFLDLKRRRTAEGWKADQRALDHLHAGLDALVREFKFHHGRDDKCADIEASVASINLRELAVAR